VALDARFRGQGGFGLLGFFLAAHRDLGR